MGISSMHNGKRKIKPSPTVTMNHRVPSVKMPLGLECQAPMWPWPSGSFQKG